MTEPNWSNRTLWTGDNLDIMRGMNSETVDLIYLDPPFNSNRDYAAPIGSEAAGAAFKDTWSLSDVDEAWHGEIADRDPTLYAIVDAAGLSNGKAMKSYLIMMAVRLLEMRRLLKDTGSIYLHCDPTASHYLKQLCDCIFGPNRFRNEIVWKRTSTKSLGTQRYARDGDRIFYYTKSPSDFVWNQQYQPHDPEYIRKNYRYNDNDGLGIYRLQPLTGGKRGGPLAYEPFRGVKPSKGRAWSPPRRDKFPSPVAAKLPANYEQLDVLAKCEALNSAGLIYWSKTGIPNYKSHLSNKLGNPASDIITHIAPASGNEAIGYPTQKPLALLDSIIKASSNRDDVVLDPFCGCATALVAADRLDRQWVGIDLSPLAAKLVNSRLRDDMGLFFDIHHRTDIPHRTDQGDLPSYRTHRHTLYGKQEGVCAGCEVMFPFRNMTVDHIVPQSKGGSDHLDNLQLLCAACNSTKGVLSQEGFIAKLRREGLR